MAESKKSSTGTSGPKYKVTKEQKREMFSRVLSGLCANGVNDPHSSGQIHEKIVRTARNITNEAARQLEEDRSF